MSEWLNNAGYRRRRGRLPRHAPRPRFPENTMPTAPLPPVTVTPYNPTTTINPYTHPLSFHPATTDTLDTLLHLFLTHLDFPRLSLSDQSFTV